jgi:cytochrome c peroxidase
MPNRLMNVGIVVCVGAVVGLMAGQRPTLAQQDEISTLIAADESGIVRTVNLNGALDLNNPFFKELGTNGRSCSSCHRPAQGWSITPESVQRRFDESRGLDPIFRANDGSNCEGADISTLTRRRAAFSQLLTKGLIRVGIDVPTPTEFVIDAVDDPYHCGAPLTTVSMYRRPLPSTNLRFLSAVMWDGRESTPATTVLQDLAHQSNDATRGHAQAALDLTTQERQDIVAFETGLFTAQVWDRDAGLLRDDGARGGPVALSQQLFFIGINDPVGLNPTNAPFDPRAFTIFDAWSVLPARPGHDAGDTDERTERARRAIARGQEIFNTKPIVISGVAGLNDQTFANGVTLPASFNGTCTTCHDAPNAGDHSVKAPLNIGLTDASRRTPDLPLYTLRRLSNGEIVKTTDPGRAMITGLWADIGKFKGPVLRALASRAPYFHNGSAASLEAVLDFYESRFGLGLTPQEKADLVAFLRAL